AIRANINASWLPAAIVGAINWRNAKIKPAWSKAERQNPIRYIPLMIQKRYSNSNFVARIALMLALVTRHRSLVTLLDTLSVFFLAQAEQSADSVMERLTAFIRRATRTIDFAVYDMRF